MEETVDERLYCTDYCQDVKNPARQLDGRCRHGHEQTRLQPIANQGLKSTFSTVLSCELFYTPLLCEQQPLEKTSWLEQLERPLKNAKHLPFFYETDPQRQTSTFTSCPPSEPQPIQVTSGLAF